MSQLRVLTWNCHLFGESIAGSQAYRDRERAERVADRIARERPDVVALNEVWDLKLAREICHRLELLYPHRAYGSFQIGLRRRLEHLVGFGAMSGLMLGGGLGVGAGIGLGMLGYAVTLGGRPVVGSGLLVLSRIPLLDEPVFRPYSAEIMISDSDKFAQKGMLAISLRPPQWSRPVELIATHLHAGEVNTAVTTRRRQIEELAKFARQLHAIHPERGQILLGDLNVWGEDVDPLNPHYEEMIEELAMIDAYRALHPEEPGLTFDNEVNELAARYGPGFVFQHRLDYVLYRQGGALKPKMVQVREDLDPDGRISDHWPLEAIFVPGRDHQDEG